MNKNYTHRIAEAVRDAAAKACANEAENCIFADELMVTNIIHSLDLDAIIASVPDDYEAKFQHETTELVMRHIDRMEDVCEQDTADRIIESFTRQFDPIFKTYMAAKFPNMRAASAQSAGGRDGV